ncbi:MAG TPA: hypothetical protein VNG33_18530, partial [Polyangiaceae bacterium]|nr:hypothetical protein [Polyangiaceae bacterium]
YNHVLLDKVAKPSGFLGGDTWESARPAADKADAKAEPGKVEEQRKSVPPPKPNQAAAKPPQDSLPDADDDVDALIQSTRPPAEEEARKKVIDKLTGISRLPPRHESLTTPVLLSIESMYEELLTASTDDAREMCIRDSFPNQQQLTVALLALIELLDPTIDINDPVIKDADVDSLIKVVLFEERHRYEQQHPSVRSAPPQAPLPPPAPGRRPSVAPPPLPRSALAPPLPEGKRAR